VPKDHDIRLKLCDQSFVRCFKLMKLAEDVTNHHALPCELFDALGRELAEPVVVSFDCYNRRYLFQLPYHFELAYVACVDDSINARKDRRNRVIE
jgi:hypothetical protein